MAWRNSQRNSAEVVGRHDYVSSKLQKTCRRLLLSDRKFLAMLPDKFTVAQAMAIWGYKSYDRTLDRIRYFLLAGLAYVCGKVPGNKDSLGRVKKVYCWAKTKENQNVQEGN